MASNQLIIVDRIVAGLQNKLALNSMQCYPSVERLYVDGMGDRVIQVVPGAVRTDGGGDGSQEGGSLKRKGVITCWVWYRLLTDMRQMSVNILTTQTQGMIDFIESIKTPLSHTYLGNLVQGTPSTTQVLTEPLFYVGETKTEWHDPQKGVVYRGITYSGCWEETLPITLTLVDGNFGSSP